MNQRRSCAALLSLLFVITACADAGEDAPAVSSASVEESCQQIVGSFDQQPTPEEYRNSATQLRGLEVHDSLDDLTARLADAYEEMASAKAAGNADAYENASVEYRDILGSITGICRQD